MATNSVLTAVPAVVLLSDPDADTRAIFSTVLRHQGIQVIDTSSAAEAIEVAHQASISAAVTELLYLDDRTCLTRGLRECAPGVRIFVITCDTRGERHRDSLAAGAEAVRLKPFMPRDLTGLLYPPPVGMLR